MSDKISQRRANALAAFARLTVKENQRRFPPQNGVEGSWLTSERREQIKAEQLAYAKPYQEEYDPELHNNGNSRPEEDLEELDQDIETLTATSTIDQSEVDNLIDAACTSIGRNDLIASLAGVRSRRIKPQPVTSAKLPPAPSISAQSTSSRSVIDFDKTSTVMPPPSADNDSVNIRGSLDVIYKHFFADLNFKFNQELPVFKTKQNIINSIKSYSVTLVEGATGCGKTTQVPAYILQDGIMDSRADRVPLIYVTQPRKIAAKSIAQRVCDEHNWELGSLVGFQVGLHKCAGPDTLLVFCTAGVLLQKLIAEKSLQGFSHIIVDEAHERDADTDLLLMMIRTLMRREKSSFRLIVMSATMNMSKLKSYFTFRTNYGHNTIITPSICKIDHEKKVTRVQTLYFDKLKVSFNIDENVPEFELDQPILFDECLRSAAKIIIEIIPHLDTFSEATKSTLVFLPGLAEICKLHGLLKKAEEYLEIIPLHSCIAYHDQLKVFESARAGRRKVILATNIAESSITVPDAGFIIDFCLTKVLMKDELTRFPVLKLQWSSQDKSIQRAGRTGRCCPGKVFRMVTNNFFKEFQPYATPELLLAPLELSVLRVKSFDMGQVKGLLAVVLDPPQESDIRTAILELKQIGALTGAFGGKFTAEDGDLTELGKVIANLPIDVHLSKLIVLAAAFDVVEQAIVIAACLSTNRTVVKHMYGRMLESYDNKLRWANGSFSDLFVSLDVYNEFKYYKEEQQKSHEWLDTFCRKKKLDERKLFEVSALVEELKGRLEQLNIEICEQPNRTRNKLEDEFLLKIAFCGAFYPNYFISQEIDPDLVRRDCCGYDPAKTVILHNFPVNNVPLYYQQIMDQLQEVVQCRFEFIADCSRALLIMDSNESMIPDENTPAVIQNKDLVHLSEGVPKPVYRAIKQGEAERVWIQQYQEEAAYERMQPYLDYRRQFVIHHRLPPPWLKVIGDRPVNNNHLLEATDEEYEELTRTDFSLEVAFQNEQEQEDRREIRRLLDAERRNDKDDMESDIFKKEVKWIRGPTSPIRVSFLPILEKSRSFNVDIDPLSVNSILLDPRYGEKNRQMLVAASVSQTPLRNRVIARDTTLMPRISGLTELMALMFSPMRKLELDEEDLNCLDSCVFGIGWDENGHPVDKDYEVTLEAEVEVTNDDIGLIDGARSHIMDLINRLTVKNPGAPRAEIQQRLRDIVLTLVRKRRPLRKKHIVVPKPRPLI